MNIASALLKQIVEQQDLDTWSQLKEIYLPGEYRGIFDVLDKHVDQYQSLPTFEELTYEVRNTNLKEKLTAIESIEVEVDADLLLDYLKNEYAQIEILDELDKYVDKTVTMATAEENIEQLQEIVLKVSDKVDIVPPAESMQMITLFEDDEQRSKYLPLGLNTDYDASVKFSPTDLVLVGGRRGSGKSLTSCNLAVNVYEAGRTALYFTIEMDSRAILQRMCSIATRVPFTNIRDKSMSTEEWNLVAGWWAGRFENGHDHLREFELHRDFDEFHRKLTKNPLSEERQLDVIYDPSLTLSKIQSELDKRVSRADVGIVIVDYLNQVRRHNAPSRNGQYDWTEQIEISKKLKTYAQEYETMVFAPYQTDSTGEARFAKGILDAADAAYSLETWTPEDRCMTFNCTKMRNNEVKGFSSEVDWKSLKIGPATALTPTEKEKMKEQMYDGADGEEAQEL
jgi:replicative DNA helicase|tara:strand:+ start:549 stop:1910 length:1362 start_codon:yes stop_codon:yes gene_type:complete